jgi:hypothetical protein
VEETSLTRTVQKKRTLLQHRHTTTTNKLKERVHIITTIGAAGMQKKRCKKGNAKKTKD